MNAVPFQHVRNHGHSRWLVLLCAGLMLNCGCKQEQEYRNQQLGRKDDPLLGKTIPNPNVPTGRETYGTKDSRDPLLRQQGQTSSLGRERGEQPNPWRPTWRSTPGALAYNDSPTGEFSDLRIPNTNRGGSTLDRTTNPDKALSELARLGAKVFKPVRTDSGQYEVRVQVPLDKSGAMSSYVGTGNSAQAALQDAYDQLWADR